MRLWQLVFLVLLAAVMLSAARDEIGRIAVVVFITGFIEFVLATLALMLLFRTIGAIGEAKRLVAYMEAVASTAAVLVTASVVMNAVFWAGLWVLQAVAR